MATDSAFAFDSFRATHPELWAEIGTAWSTRNTGPASQAFYRGMRHAVCVVGQFPEALFDGECERAFGR